MVFALLKENKIVKIVQCEKDTPLSILFPDYKFIEVTNETGFPNLNFYFDGKRFLEREN